jgi:hypothetical protein
VLSAACFMRRGKGESLPAEHDAPCSDGYQMLDAGEQACGKYARSLSKAGLEEKEDCHCCCGLERDI